MNPEGDAGIEMLRAQLAARTKLYRRQAALFIRRKKTFERAASMAKIGVWECRLTDQQLTWTEQVYTMFDLPQGRKIDRGLTLALYSEGSRAMLEAERSKAIEQRSGFALDAEITTAKGRHRWIRLTAAVECEDGVPVRIFGTKQDITDEKILADRTRYLAEFDSLTGLANRSLFEATLSALGDSVVDRSSGALLLVDLDGFKKINDNFGHSVGDECLRQAAGRLREVCRQADLVARIGGDEFAVLLNGRLSRDEIDAVAERIVVALRRPMTDSGLSFTVGASVGIAPAEGFVPAKLFTMADAALYAAKAAGRNTFRSFNAAMMLGHRGRQLIDVTMS